MGLAEDEQRALDEIEQHLAKDDPHLAAKITNAKPPLLRVSSGTLFALGVLVICQVGVLVVVVGAAISSTALIVLGAGIATGGFVWLIGRTWRARRR